MKLNERAVVVFRGLGHDPEPEITVAFIERNLREAVNDALERAAVACDAIYQRYGEAVRECDTPAGHERLKNRAGGAGECAVAVRALKEAP